MQLDAGQAERARFARSRWVPWLYVVSGAGALLGGASAIAPQLEIEPVAAFGLGFSAVCASALATAVACPAVGRRALLPAVALACGLFALTFFPRVPALALAILVTIGLLAAASLIGAVVGRAVGHPGHLSLVAIVSSASDLASVLHPSGPSAAIAQSEVALSILALPWPMLGTHAIEPMLGGGDVVFAALYVAAARKHGLSLARTVTALSLGLLASLVCVVWFERAVPALPFLGAAIIAAHPEVRRLPPADRLRGGVVAALLFALAVALLALR